MPKKSNPVVKKSDDLGPIWKALSDPTRRAILDVLRDQQQTTTTIVEAFPHLTRFAVMKHLEVLREAGLVHTREEGRQRLNSLNVYPIRQIYERWVSPFQEMWASQLLGIKLLAEEDETQTAAPPAEDAGTNKQTSSASRRKK